MSLDLVGLPCEIRFKIFDHVSVADLTKWLKIQKLRDSILAFLEDEGKVFLFLKNFMVRHGLDLYRKLRPKSLKRSPSFTDGPRGGDGPRRTGLKRRTIERKPNKSVQGEAIGKILSP